ncbi:TadE/TadG family type IV pilus assembly protein [uncultured Cohaesibacter sp.]|uniref:TadE/TadG family type IV pilus assembly protein n=1 Tax=uncultured Cohaesibacter sp. TaxID=1002546 RepID=UPI00292D03A6|nr:TadE/TadG family type IV pilus assembly protein [uncultured Cohaesibacter sp.]
MRQFFRSHINRLTDSLRLKPVHQRKGFITDCDGATAVEFAILALPFLAFLYMLIAMGYVYLANTTLEDATQQAGRQIRVGAVASSNLSKSGFKSLICDGVAISTSDCLSSIIVDVTSSEDISDLDLKAPMTDGALDIGQETYDPGEASDYVMVKAYLPMAAVNQIFSLLDSDASPNFILSSVMVFRSEPYE